MTRTAQPSTTATSGATANTAPTKVGREAAPRRWWRALDRMTLETMNPPLPAGVRSAINDRDSHASETSGFAAAIRAGAPGRSTPAVGSNSALAGDFAARIRAAAPGRRTQH